MTYGESRQLDTALAASVRAAYFEARRTYCVRLHGENLLPGKELVRKWDGSEEPEEDDRAAYNTRNSAGLKRRPAWLQIVEFADRNGVSALELIQARFQTDSPTIPTPEDCKDFYSLKLAKESTEFAEVLASRLRGAFDCDMAVFKRDTYMQVTHANSPAEIRAAEARVLTLLTTRISPVFRYIQARARGIHGVAEAWKSIAQAHYVLRWSAYDQVYGNLIPPELSQLARRPA